MPLILPGNVASATAAGYEVANSCRFDDGDSPKMVKQLGTPSSQQTFTLSTWFKLGNVNTGANRVLFCFDQDSNDLLTLYLHSTKDQLALYSEVSGSAPFYQLSNALIRDPSAWYHVAAIIDGTNGTQADRLKIYLNGTQITSWATDTQWSSVANIAALASGNDIIVGAGQVGSASITLHWEGYLAETVYLDGTAAAIGDLGEFDEDSPNIWKPKDVSGLSFGNNGFYCDYEASDNLGNDANGGTDLTETNVAATDQSTDTPTNNYAIVNPLFRNNLGGVTFSEGNLKFAETNSPSESTPGSSSIAVANGKWYWEVYCEEDEGEDKFWIGASTVESAQNVLTAAGTSYIWGLRTGSTGVSLYNDVVYRNAGGSYTEVLTAGLTSGAASDGDIIKMAIDLDNGKVWFGKNDEWSNGSASISSTLDASNHDTTVTAGTDHFLGCGGEGCICWANFGSPARAISSGNEDANGYGNFEYAVPSGFYALNTKNLAEFG